ncbi:TPA: hypothetical protein JZF11_004560 [Escherichia coli]|nr:hypothetical protein [Escherichia coli]ELS5669601.1 hypothetical protein [Escherichia coli]MXG42716.1 hypothetical protein [Escherichia coli]MXG65283.1 hypothetical protein [Escherichia coli]HAN8870838.1 hypothetical protein [Escherichia coli]
MKKNGAEIYNRTALDNTLIYSGVIDMPAGRGHMTLEFSVSSWLVNDWYRVLLQAQVHTHILWVLVLIRTRLRLAHMDTPSPLTLLVTRKTPSKTSHLTIL